MSNFKRTYFFVGDPYLQTFGDWRVRMSEDPDPVFSFSLTPARTTDSGVDSGPRLIRNIFELRTAFFAIRDAAGALEFFRTFGPMRVKEMFGTVADSIRLSELMSLRDFFEDALQSRSVEKINRKYSAKKGDLAEGFQNMYLWQPLQAELLFGQPLQGRIVCRDAEHAVRVSVFLDRSRGLPWRRCAREDCGRVFEHTSKRRKFYCDAVCAHLESVRSYNRRQQAERIKKQHKAKSARKRKA